MGYLDEKFFTVSTPISDKTINEVPKNPEEINLDILATSLEFYELQIFISLARSISAVSTNSAYFEVVKRIFEYWLLSESSKDLPKEDIKKIREAYKNHSWATWLKTLRKRKNLGLAIPSYRYVERILENFYHHNIVGKREMKGLRGGKQGCIWFLNPKIKAIYLKKRHQLLKSSKEEIQDIPQEILYFYDI